MKFFFTSILFFFFSITFAQTYAPFPVNNAVWIVSKGCTDGLPCFCNDIIRYEMISDTTINSFVYKRIFETDSSYCTAPCSCQITSNAPSRFIREDGNKKIWVYDPFAQADTLLYDFNLNVGDTINNTVLCAYVANYAVISSIDSIFIGNNYRKRFFYQPAPMAGFDTCSTFLIEGIGNAGGLFEPLCGRFCFEAGFNLECFKQNGIVEYFSDCPMSTDSNYVCNILSSIEVASLKQKDVKVFPNPASTEIQITYFNFQSGDQIIFSDVTGKNLFTKKITAPTTILKLKTLIFSNGIYFLQIKTKDGVLNKKVIVQH